MEEKRFCYEELVNGWNTLNSALKTDCKVNMDIFTKTFTETFNFFKAYGKKTEIERVYIGLIVSASIFAAADSENLDFKSRAALILTERMLRAIVNNACVLDEAVVYVLEMREEICLDFMDVEGSVKKLARVLEESCLS